MRKITNCVQGVISALLSNIYLIDYDYTLNLMAKDMGFVYRRYCDDIILVCPTSIANDVKSFAINEIKNEYKLTIQSAKAEVIDFIKNSRGNIRSFRRLKNQPEASAFISRANENSLYKNLQYLGFEFNGKEIFIRSSSVSRYFQKMKSRLDKTVAMAYGKNSEGEKIHRFQMYERYTHFGEQNFVTYALRAAQNKYKNKKGDWQEGFNSSAIKKQLSRHFNILNKSLEAKNIQKYRIKQLAGEETKLMKL